MEKEVRAKLSTRTFVLKNSLADIYSPFSTTFCNRPNAYMRLSSRVYRSFPFNFPLVDSFKPITVFVARRTIKRIIQLRFFPYGATAKPAKSVCFHTSPNLFIYIALNYYHFRRMGINSVFFGVVYRFCLCGKYAEKYTTCPCSVYVRLE